jgi:hypothetical protein
VVTDVVPLDVTVSKFSETAVAAPDGSVAGVVTATPVPLPV